MDLSHLSRLKEEEQLAIQQTEEKIQIWEKYKNDYLALKDRMKTLPDKLCHDVMVPFGSLAFMPGKLVDTNRVLVLLGDNWFAERATKQACEIVDRRIEGINSTLKDLSSEKDLLESRIGFTSELKDVAESRGGLFEITEEYIPEKEKAWREQHKKNVQKHRQEIAKQKLSSGTCSNEDVWAKLDELALQERLGHEMAKLDEQLSPNSDQTVNTSSTIDEQRKDGQLRKSVSWNDEVDGKETCAKSNDTGDEENSEQDSSEEEEESDICKKIIFRHSPREEEKTKDSSAGDVVTTINSPRDIYQQFFKPTSILKPTNQVHVEEPQPEHIRERVVVAGSQAAFSGNIVERNTSDLTPVNVEPSQPKRVSKFKQRQSANR